MSSSSAPPASQPILVCFSHLRWNFVWQRPQHLMSRAAQGWRVYFFEEPVFETTSSSPELKATRDDTGVTVITPTLPASYGEREATSAQQTMLESVLARHPKSPVYFWYYTPLAIRFSYQCEPDLCVYDCMDELSAFKGAPAKTKAYEKMMFSLADLVFTGGRSLYEAKKLFHSSVFAFPSSVDRAHFAQARGAVNEPSDQASIGRPRIGFFGVIDERFDADLVASLADLKPDWQLVMVGPVVKIDPETLPRRPNIHWLGSKHYRDLPRYLSGWDAGVMPFAINEATRYISPTKTPEFLAAGLPVVSTPVRDVVVDWGAQQYVRIGDTAAAVAEHLEQVMQQPREDWLARVDRKLATLSWNNTWTSMRSLMLEKLSSVPISVPAVEGRVRRAGGVRRPADAEADNV